LLFADDKDLTLDASYLLVREGRLTIGTEQEPRKKKLTITMWSTIEDK
jgi:hypothetical protein